MSGPPITGATHLRDQMTGTTLSRDQGATHTLVKLYVLGSNSKDFILLHDWIQCGIYTVSVHASSRERYSKFGCYKNLSLSLSFVPFTLTSAIRSWDALWAVECWHEGLQSHIVLMGWGGNVLVEFQLISTHWLELWEINRRCWTLSMVQILMQKIIQFLVTDWLTCLLEYLMSWES